MKAHLFRKLFIFLSAVVPLHAADKEATVFLNGNVYTGAEEPPYAEAVAVRDQRILFVGSNAEAKQKYPKARVVDLEGKTVVPGLTDSHCHIFGIGDREMRLDLERTDTLEKFLSKVQDRAVKTGTGKWVVGRGWIETFWKPPQFPSRQDLDKIAGDHPVYLTRADGHASIANTKALAIAGIDKNTPNPFGGQILKDSNGEPTGMLLDNAQDLVETKIPKPTKEEREQALLLGVEREIRLGWCEIQNAGSHKEDIELIRKNYATGKIKIRMYNAVFGPGPDANDLLKNSGIDFQSAGGRTRGGEPINSSEDRQAADATVRTAINEEDHRFTQRTIKVILDGALGSRGAALLKPYSDRPETSGYLRERPEELRRMFVEALRSGIQVETHAIGDRANRLILDLYEEAFKAVPPEQRKNPDPRWRVEHAQNVTTSDIPRFAELGVIASMQPSHAISDLFFAPARLGMDRLSVAYPWQSLLQTGAIICGGSDAPVERGEPMIEFYAAVARKSIHGETAEGWHPEQAVSRQDALKMFTKSAAYAAFEEKDKGSIEPGKLADLTVLSADIMKIPEPEILKTRCLMTVIGGEIVYDGRRD